MQILWLCVFELSIDIKRQVQMINAVRFVYDFSKLVIISRLRHEYFLL